MQKKDEFRDSLIRKHLNAGFAKRILITGAGGMLGNSFVAVLDKYSPTDMFNVDVAALRHDQLDVRNREAVLSYHDWIKDGWIIHCAALVSVEGCASNPDLAKETIVGGTQNIIDLASLSGAGVLYPQSFLVFDGSDQPIPEEEMPRPLALYGQLKFEAETLVRKSLAKSICVRMAGFFGGQQRDKNFVGKIIQEISRKIKAGEPSISIGDRVWQPTWTDDLALNSLLLMGAEKTGIYQMACHGTASFYDLTKEIVKQLNWQDKIKIVKVSVEDVTSQELGKRPSRAELSCQYIREQGLDIQRPWAETLEEYLSDPYFNQYRDI